MKLRKHKKGKIINYFNFLIIIISISFILTFVIINYLSKQTNKILYPMAVSETRKVVTMIINSACDDVLINNNLYSIVKDNNEEIKMINYDTKEATKIINIVTSNIMDEIRDIEIGKKNYYGEQGDGVIAVIPFGVIFNNTFMNNLGPKIKIRLKLLGDIMSNLETEVKPYGINNAYVEVRIHLTVTARIVLPFVSDEVVISNVIPIAMNVVSGNVPTGYVYSYK